MGEDMPTELSTNTPPSRTRLVRSALTSSVVIGVEEITHHSRWPFHQGLPTSYRVIIILFSLILPTLMIWETVSRHDPNSWLHHVWTRWTRHRMRLPPEGVGYLIIMIVCFIGSSITRSNPLMLVFSAMAGPFIINGSIIYGMLKNLRVQRHPPPRAMQGEMFPVEIVVRNTSRWLSAWLLTVQDIVRKGTWQSTASVLMTHVGKGEERSTWYYLQLPGRGRYYFGSLRVSSRFPLGLVERICLFNQPQTLLVYPCIGRLTSRWRQLLLGATELVEAPLTSQGAFDDEFYHLREYRTGDNPRAIHWRTSARRQELIVREYRPNREFDLVVIIDLSTPTPTSSSDLVDGALSLALTICWEHRERCRGAELSVLFYGAEHWRCDVSATGSGLEDLLDRMALAEPAAQVVPTAAMSSTLLAFPSAARFIGISLRDQPPELSGREIQWLIVTPHLLAQILQPHANNFSLEPQHDRIVSSEPTTPWMAS